MQESVVEFNIPKTSALLNLQYRTAIIVLLLTLVCGAAARCGSVIGRHLNIRGTAELGQARVSNIIQSQDGFLWAATWNGLARFDGNEIFLFSPVNRSRGSIDSNRIYNIKLGSGRGIWCVSSDNRLFLFDPDSCIFTNVSASIKAFRGKKVKNLTPLRNGYTWVTFADGATARLNDTLPLSSPGIYPTPSALVKGARAILGIDLDTNGVEWVLTDAGALNTRSRLLVKGEYRFVESTRQATFLFGSDGRIVKLSGKRAVSIYGPDHLKPNHHIRDGNRVAIATDRGIHLFDLASGTSRFHSTSPVSMIAKDSRHRIWALGHGRVVYMCDSHGNLSTLRAPQSPAGTASAKSRPVFFETPTEDVVIKSSGSPLCRLDERTGLLSEIEITNSTAAATAAETAEVKKYLADAGGNLWIVYNGAVDCLRFSTDLFGRDVRGAETRGITVDNDGNVLVADMSPRLTSSTGESLSCGPGYVLRHASPDELWMGTKGEGIFIIGRDGGGKRGHSVTHLTRGTIHSDTIYDILFDRRDRVWLGSYGNGLAKGELRDGKWRFEYVAGQPPNMKIRSITSTGDGHLILATADGLVTTDAPSSGSPRFFVNRYRPDSRGLKGNDIMNVVKAGDRFHAIVYGYGTSRIDSRNLLYDSLMFTNFPLPTQAAADQTKTAVAQGGDIYIISGHSITRLNTVTGRQTVYGRDYFPHPVTFTEASPAITPDGHIILGTDDGILTLTPDALAAPGIVSAPAITGIRFRNDAAVTPLNCPRSLPVEPGRRTFTLYLSDMSFDDRHLPDFRYRLQGFEEGWNYVNDSRMPTISYNNLPPGDYNLIFETESADGSWTRRGNGFAIKVTPMFTETPLFKLIVMTGALTLLAALTGAVIHFRRMRDALQRKYSLLMTIDRVSTAVASRGSVNGATNDAEDADTRFIERIVSFLDKNIDNPDLVVEDFARELHLSRTTFYNRMRQITGCSPVEFIRQLRIKRALKLLENEQLSISEVAYLTGFTDPKYFSRCFKAEMGVTPSRYAATVREAGQQSDGS